MHYSTDPAVRQDFITGLRMLADFLDTHTDVPVPLHTREIQLTASRADNGGCAQVDRFAALTGASVEDGLDKNGLYEAGRSFGSLSYRMVAVSSASMALMRAAGTYYGYVTPDTQAATDA